MHFTLRKINRRRRLAWKMILFGQFSRPERKRMCREFFEVFWGHFLFAVRGHTVRPQFVSLSAYRGDPRLLSRAFNPRFVRKSQLSLTKTVWTQEKLPWIIFFENQHISSSLARPAICNKCYIYAGFSTKRSCAALHLASVRLIVHLLVSVSEVVHFPDENLNYWLLN